MAKLLVRIISVKKNVQVRIVWKPLKWLHTSKRKFELRPIAPNCHRKYCFFLRKVINCLSSRTEWVCVMSNLITWCSKQRLFLFENHTKMCCRIDHTIGRNHWLNTLDYSNVSLSQWIANKVHPTRDIDNSSQFKITNMLYSCKVLIMMWCDHSLHQSKHTSLRERSIIAYARDKCLN